MKFHGITLEQGSSVANLTVSSGTAFPTSPDEGELFFRSDTDLRLKGLYLYVGGSWDRIASTDSLTLPNGAVLPTQANEGDVFYLSSGDASEGIYVFRNDSWVAASGEGTAPIFDVTGDVTGTIDGGTDVLTLVSTTVTPGSYGSATQAGTFAVDAKGRLTGAADVLVTPAWSSVTGTPTTLAGYGITNAVLKTGDTMTGPLAITGTGSGLTIADGNLLLTRAIDNIAGAQFTNTSTGGDAETALYLTNDAGDYFTVSISGSGFTPVAQASTAYVWTDAAAISFGTNSIERLRISNGAFGLGGANYGTSGQVLTSAGSAAVPTWTTPLGGTVTSVATVQPTEGLTITGGPITSSGTLTFELANDLAALEELTTTGLATRTAADTWVSRSIAVVGSGISVADGGGVAGNPTITLVSATAATPSTLVFRDASGNFSAGTITAALTGNATTATTLATGRTFSITGDVTASGISFDGSANVALASTLGTTAVAPGSYGSTTQVGTFTVSGQGRLTAAANAAIAFPVTSVAGQTGAVTLTTANITGYGTVTDAVFTLTDDGDPTKVAKFEASGITTATTRTYTLPNADGTIAITGALAQTFSGALTFSNAALTVGSATTAATYNLGTGATTSGNTKTINLGTAGVAGSTTVVNVGSSTSNTTINLTGKVVLAGDPATSLEAATKSYVDAIKEGLNVHAASQVGSAVNLPATYANGTAGEGATLTASANGVLVVDGVNPVVGNRVLLGGQSNTAHNGIYVVTNVGSASTQWVLTRATDFDTADEIQPGDFVFNQGGTTRANTGYVQTQTVTTVGTDPIVFYQFSGTGAYIGGAGLTLTGTTFDIGTGSATRIVVNPDNIDLATVTDLGTGTFLKLTRDAYGRVAGTTPVVVSDITSLVNASYVQKAGDLMTGALGITAGLVGTPGLYFSGDTNTGLFSPAADTFAITTGGTERLRISSAGDVGIATAPSSSFKLTVAGNIGATGNVLLAGTTPFISFNPTLGASTEAYIELTTSTHDFGFYSNDAAGFITFHTGSSSLERLRVAASGAIGLSGANYGTSGQVLTSAGSGSAPTWTTQTVGSVVSVGVSGANGIGVSGSPVTSSGTIALSLEAITPTSVTVPLGAAATPSITFSGDPNTGIYSSAADTINFATAGVSEFSLSSGLAAFGGKVSGSSSGLSVPSWTTSGCTSQWTAGTVTDNSSAAAATVSSRMANSFSTPTFASTNAITVTNAATMYIAGAPVAGTNTTLTNTYALWIDGGECRIDGNIDALGGVTGALTGNVTGNVTGTLTGNVIVPLGTVTVPSISFSGDSNTGIYSPAADQLAITTAGTQAISFDASGNTNVTGGLGIRAGVPSTSASAVSSFDVSANATRYGIQSTLNITSSTLTGDRSHFGVYSLVEQQDQSAEAFSSHDYAFYGLARTSATAGTSVNGEGSLTGVFGQAAHQSADATYFNVENMYGGRFNILLNGATAATDQAYGVNSTFSSSAAGSNIATGYLYYGSFGTVTGTITNRYGVYIVSDCNNYFTGGIQIGGTAAGPATAFGLGVGVAPPGAGEIQSSATIQAGGQLYAAAGTASTSTTTGALRVTGGAGISGAVFIGGVLSADAGSAATSTTTGSIQVTGGIGLTGAVYAGGEVTAFSDRRVKDNLQLIPDALAKVERLNGYTYTRSDLPEEEGKRHAGVIAQEVEEVLPEVVTTGEDGFKGVAYGNMVALLIESVKELSAKVRDLETRLARHEN